MTPTAGAEIQMKACNPCGEKLKMLTLCLHTKHINQLALGKECKDAEAFESACIPNVRTKR